MGRRAKYYCPVKIVYRDDKTGHYVTVPKGYPSDGASGPAIDIWSRSWWVHDVLCDRGTWDDGTPVTPWTASRVLADILKAEKRLWRAWRWRWATFLFGPRKLGVVGMRNPSPHNVRWKSSSEIE